MRHITETMINCILAALIGTTIVALGWLFLSEMAYKAEHPKYTKCLTEDQPGWCIWKGEIRYYEDNVNIQR